MVEAAIVEDLTLPESGFITEIEVIEDWEDRMNRANYSESQRDIMAKVNVKK